MSKRLQVLLPEKEYKELQKLCRQQKRTVADWVRQSIRDSIKQARPKPLDKRLASILKYAQNEGPTGDIEQLLSEIEKGKK